MGRSLDYPGQMIGPYFCGLGGRGVSHALFSWREDGFYFLAEQGLGHTSADSYSRDVATRSDPILSYIFIVAKPTYTDLLKAGINDLQILTSHRITGVKCSDRYKGSIVWRLGIFLLIPCKDSLLD